MLLRQVPGAGRALLMTPASAHDRYHAPMTAPMFSAQLYFDALAMAEAAIGRGGILTAIVPANFASLYGSHATHQLMLARPFPVPPANGAPGARSCAFLVHYPGRPENLNDWLSHYLAHHPPIMATFPAIREIEVCTRMDWVDAAPWERVTHFQRNKIVFDHAGALEAALNSPVRDLMKQDFDAFPAFTGGSVHVPMACEVILG
ncbi:hypothetical protein [Sphingobium sp.]|uniref:hypothetical protein n=1 Tax=Sphingobium sp. TaxID=1912891 RepID=UPI0028BED0A9|nr:hypothetical protein [Sphingobium sp.]